MGVLTGTFNQSKQRDESQQHSIFTQEWLEPRLVVITLLAIIISFAAERLDVPAWVIVVANITAYLAGGLFGTKAALEGLRQRHIDVDMLMILAALGAASVDQWQEGAILLFLFSLSNVLQTYAIGRSRQAIKSLLKLYPNEARIKDGDATKIVHIDQIRVGDVVLIQPGERIPVDGIVRVGHSAVDQAPITGESLPVAKTPGDTVFAGTLNQRGALDIEATQTASNTTLARIIQMVEQAQDSKAPTERMLETFEQYYALLIISVVALFIVLPPLLTSADFQDNFYRAMILMTVASPCALVISTPAAFISAIAAGARRGVLFKGGAYLEAMAAVQVVAFDKTGTLTVGKPSVTDVVSCCELSENELLSVAVTVESRSEHPLAKAVLDAAESRGITPGPVEDFEAVTGKGIAAKVDGQVVHLGSIAYLERLNPIPAHLEADRVRLENEGKTVIGVIRADHCDDCKACVHGMTGCEWMGLLAIADRVRPEAKAAIAHIKASGVQHLALLTGDNDRVARAIAEEVGIDRVYANLMPEDKANIVRQLGDEVGSVAMVGDGVNDAPALATAAVGIAMGVAGTDVALETADLVLMGDRLELIAYALYISKKARRVVLQNIAFSIAVIVVLIAGVFVVSLPLPVGVLGHEGSTVIVVLNGLIALLLWPEIQHRRRQQTE